MHWKSGIHKVIEWKKIAVSENERQRIGSRSEASVKVELPENVRNKK